MKKIGLYLLLLLMLACKKDEDFNPYDYNGEYPRSMNGKRIKTYSPEIHGGEIQVKFNDHSWNHAPYLSIRAREMNPPFTNVANQELGINLSSHLTYGFIEACVFETLSLVIPLKEGRQVFSEEMGNQYYTRGVGGVFYSINCDAGKDHYQFDLTKTSWFDIKRYDKTTRDLEAEFDLHFIIQDRNSDFGPIYPKHVNLKGKIKTVAELFE